MRLVHFADCHLGHTRFNRTTKTGQNQRQSDVELAFCRLIDAVIGRAPDVVVVGGDLFDVPRPNNRTITTAMQEFSRLTRALPNCAVVIVAGNHDTPRADEHGHIFRLLATLPLHVVDAGIARIDLDGVSIACVPDTATAQREIRDMKAKGMTIGQLGNEKAARNVLLMHGEIEGMLPVAAHLPATAHRSEVERPLDEIAPDAWAYVALGHWHVYREMAPRCYYSGSLEYTSTDPWTEMRQEAALGISGKGFIEHDLETGAHTFHPLDCTRRHVELPTLSAEGMTCAEIDTALADRVAAADITGAVVRIVVTEITRETVRGLDQTALRKYGLRALNFNLDPRRPDPTTRIVVRSSESPRGALALPLRVAEALRDRSLPPDVSREELIERASKYLEETKLDGTEESNLMELLLKSVKSNTESLIERTAA